MRSKNGFALIELMVVVAILSVVAAFFVPRYLKHRVQRKQDECHADLRSLFEAERQLFQKTNAYSTDLNALGWKQKGKGGHEYHFLPPPLPRDGFLFECVGNIDKDSTLDQATIDETGRITQVSDDIRK